MVEVMDEITVVLIPMAGLTGALCVAGGLEYLCNVYNGITPAPRWMTRRFWHRVLVRVICLLAELEAQFEQRKSPRKAATKRGIVGQRIRRSACIYTTIIPQPTLDVKGNLPLRVEWRWMRG